METGSAALFGAFRAVPKHVILRDFLGAETAEQVRSYALENQAGFVPTKIAKDKGSVDTSRRKSMALRELGPARPVLKERLAALLPDLTGSLGVTEFELSVTELELTAHGNGGFFRRHIDTMTGGNMSGQSHQRMISGVYYFHSQPKGFEGGKLRLYPLAPDAPDFAEIEPAHNTLVVFPSWAPHEVQPVVCSSGRFEDSRFAINCWLCRKTPGAA
jgi:Rps23 Pro-64 3,4-dihydroxylase Tpa1-like proline 4-hydroxylase